MTDRTHPPGRAGGLPAGCPDILGWPLERARPALEAAGWAVETVEIRPPAGGSRSRPTRYAATGPWRAVAVRLGVPGRCVILVVAREVPGPITDDPPAPGGSAAEGDGHHG